MDLCPVLIRIEQPILLLKALWLGIDQWDIQYVEYLRVATVFVLSLLLRHLAVLAGAHRPNPFTGLIHIQFPSREAAAIELA